MSVSKVPLEEIEWAVWSTCQSINKSTCPTHGVWKALGEIHAMQFPLCVFVAQQQNTKSQDQHLDVSDLTLQKPNKPFKPTWTRRLSINRSMHWKRSFIFLFFAQFIYQLSYIRTITSVCVSEPSSNNLLILTLLNNPGKPLPSCLFFFYSGDFSTNLQLSVFAGDCKQRTKVWLNVSMRGQCNKRKNNKFKV